MSLNRIQSDLAGTALTKFAVALGAARIYLKAISGGFAVRNADDSADAELTASKVNVSGDVLVLNSDAAGSGADWLFTIQRAASGMTAAVTLTLPPNDGSPGQVLTSDGSGVLTWETPSGGVSNMIQTDITALAFGDSSPVTMFTKPANAKLLTVRIYVDTLFNGTAPTLSIGISGTVSKYGTTGQVNLKEVGLYTWDPGVAAVAGTEGIIATYAADSSSAGAARMEVDYVVPG